MTVRLIRRILYCQLQELYIQILIFFVSQFVRQKSGIKCAQVGRSDRAETVKAERKCSGKIFINTQNNTVFIHVC